MDKDLTVDELLDKYLYLKYLNIKNPTQKILFLTKKEYDKYDEDAKIKYGFMKNISISLLKDLLQKEDYYKYVLDLFENETGSLKICYIQAGDLCGAIELTKLELLKAVEMLLSKENNLQIKEQYEFLKEKIAFNKFYEKQKDQEFKLNIEGYDYTFQVKDFLDFLLLDNLDFLDICLNEEITYVKGVPKAYFFYALTEYLTPDLMQNNYFTDEFLTHYQDLKNYALYDFQAINTFLEIKDPNINKVKINSSLHQEILKDLPNEYNDLEKAIFIYLKLCKALTYDEEFYAMHQHGKVVKKHEDINNISLITPDNNKVVCYEFNEIYAKFLQELGINFTTKQTFLEKFGGGHASLTFRSSKFIVSADAVTTILKGDMTSAKFNQKIIGLQAMNRKIETRKEFANSLKKVYDGLVKTETPKDKLENSSLTFAQIVACYRQVSRIEEISFKERLDIFFQKLQTIPEIGIDNISYVIRLQKILFTIEELDNIMDLKVISNKETLDNRLAKASVVITINEDGIKNNKENNLYYLYSPGEEIRLLRCEELFVKFSRGLYEYMSDGVIPGISGGRNVK